MPYKKIAFFAIVILLFYTINNLVHSIYVTWQKQDLIVKTQSDLEKVTEENQKLKQKLAQVKKPEFIETEARNKLFLAKPDEGIVVIPTSGLIPSKSPTSTPHKNLPNWKLWWEVFFKS